jgi:hypothetical protein
MRTVRVLFRKKSQRSDLRLSAKVVTNCRVPDRTKPVQIHLGYLPLRLDGGISSGQRSKLLRNLRKKWLLYFANEEVDVDWDDAEIKLSRLRHSPTDTPGNARTDAREAVDGLS